MEEENELKERLQQNEYEAIAECKDPNVVASNFIVFNIRFDKTFFEGASEPSGAF